jgi:hypothetical protein
LFEKVKVSLFHGKIAVSLQNDWSDATCENLSAIDVDRLGKKKQPNMIQNYNIGKGKSEKHKKELKRNI